MGFVIERTMQRSARRAGLPIWVATRLPVAHVGTLIPSNGGKSREKWPLMGIWVSCGEGDLKGGRSVVAFCCFHQLVTETYSSQ